MREPSPVGVPCGVLFLCTGNAGRSILAEAMLNHVGGPRFRAYSAGSRPKGTVNPRALALLRHLAIDTAGLASKSWDAFAGPVAPRIDIVITLCDSIAGQACPVWPGQPMRAHWSLSDPTAADGPEAGLAQAWSDVGERVRRGVEALCALPLAGLDRGSLQARIEAIGAVLADPGAEAAA
ncbi:MAG: arsenate reductase ArsC [Proteobacteria bacterium]|nr:arsenate reductase ArsC [Pseudomonadota bacterium]